MKPIIKFTSLTLTIFSLTFQNIQAQCHIDDWTALKALYESTDGDNWINNTNWQEVIGNEPTANCNLANLYGVGLDAQGRVDIINLYSNQLNGNIPYELGNLSKLQTLILPINQISGNIPNELGNLRNLKKLDLCKNQLNGNIPLELGNLSKMQDLDLDENQLTGSIPNELGNLCNLEFLDLDDNQFVGSIPPQLGNLNRLSLLEINDNQLSGCYDNNLATLCTQLNHPMFDGDSDISVVNNFDASWEDFCATGAGGCELNPQSINAQCHIDDWTALKALYESTDGDNWINNTNWQEVTGSEPTSNCNLETLYAVGLDVQGRVDVLLLYNNELNGTIPSELDNLSNLKKLDLCKNQLKGTIPVELGNLSKMQDLDLDENQLSGTILAEFGNLCNLEKLDLDQNQLSGSIPYQLGNLCRLSLLEISNNQLSGCYDYNLEILCTQLNHLMFDGDADISDGNNFDAPWEDFCATEVGVCNPTPPNPTNTLVYPGDKNNDGIVDQKDVSIIGYLYETGPPRAPDHQNTDWYGHPCEDWDDNLPFNGANIKHLDCNGDGSITTADADAVLDNLGFTHDEGGQQIGTFVFPETNYQIYLQPVDDLDNDNLLEVNVVLESKNGSNLNLQGGYFTIDYNNINTNITNAAMNFTNSWLGSPNINLIGSYSNFPNFQQIEIGFSKTNGTNSTGKGIIGQLTFVLDNNAMRTANSLLDFEVIEIGVHDSQGNIQPIEEQLLQVGLNESNCQTNWTITEDSPFYNVYKSNGTIATDGFVLVGKEQQVQYSANRVSLEEGFSVRAGANFKVRYGSCN